MSEPTGSAGAQESALDVPGGAPRFDPELAARFRAAFAYAGKTKPKDIAVALAVSTRTVHRLANGNSEIDQDLKDRVTQLTGVPRWFMEHGFDPSATADDPVLAERVERLDNQMETVLEILTGRVAGDATGPGRQGAAGDRVGGRTSDPRG
jgi:plasmid maintenance system antidote protein VapI